MNNVIFIHGLISSGHGFKGNFFRSTITDCLTPDFEEYNSKIPRKDLLKIRMIQLNKILSEEKKWKIIGSSFGGLMGTLFTINNPEKVDRLILLAPLLIADEYIPSSIKPIEIPVTIFHGKNDNIIPIKPIKTKAEILFKNLIFNIVNDDHQLQNTVKSISWLKILDLN